MTILASVFHAARFSSERRPCFAAIDCNAKPRNKARDSWDRLDHVAEACRPPKTMRAALLLSSVALCSAFVAQPSRPRLTKAYNADPRNRGNAGFRVSANTLKI